ncbi:MAG: phytoene/squalene synthase family protein, partial [Acidiferrobacterales bacterium]
MSELAKDQGNKLSDEQYQDAILQGVSRTFALTIPQLPLPLCRVVGNAYLLCRIADTIEDEPALTADQKRYFSELFIKVVKGESPSERFATELFPLLTESTLATERDLIKNTPCVIRMTHSFSQNQRVILSRAVAIMAQGMSVFQANKDLKGLEDLPQLDRYCYYVAGVVGEMLTELFCDYSPEVEKKRKQMMKLAVSFGQGLQMTNILKDIWEDRMRGACWLPRDVFKQSRFDLKDLSQEHYEQSFGDGLEKLIGIARMHLRNALSYTLLIPKKERGIRRFCLWALGMAVLTLRKIHHNHAFTSGDEVKISRRSVKATILATNL